MDITPLVPALHRRIPQHLARRFAQICASMLAEIPAPFGAPGWHFALLRQIRETPDLDRNGHAAALGSDATSTGKALEMFEQRGYVVRTPRPSDRRANTYAITPDGEALFHELAGPVRAVASRILSPLTDAEADILLALLTKLVNAHEDHARPGGGRRKPTRPKKPT